MRLSNPSACSSAVSASIGEKALFLLNDKREWVNLQRKIRANGVATNGAARYIIIDYLQNMPEPNEEIAIQLHLFEHPNSGRRLSNEYSVSCMKRCIYHLIKSRTMSSRSA